MVGMGSIAKRHLANLRHLHPLAKIYAVSASGNNKMLPENADAVVTLDELITLQPDYAIVASPAPFHADVAQKLMSHGIAVLIEKPLAHNVETCFSLQAFCQLVKSNVVAVGYCLRFLPSALVVKDYLEQGLLGKVYNVSANVGQYLPSWRADKSYKESVSASKELGGGALLELSHELDYLHWLLGDLKLLHSWLRISDEMELSVEDIVNLVLLSGEGTYVSVHLDFIQKSTQRNCEFIGQHGRLAWDLIANTVTLYNAGGKETLYTDASYNKNLMYLDMLIAFESQMKNGISKLASVASATQVVKLIDDAKQRNKWSQKI